MTWVRVDDQMPEHPKWERLEESPERWARAMSVWVAACCYCSRQLTDGLITRARLSRLTPLGPKAIQAADDLVEARLWERDGDEYRVHDYTHYNPSARDVMAQRASAAERQRRRRLLQLANGDELSQCESPRDNQRDSHEESQCEFAAPVPSPPVPPRKDPFPEGGTSGPAPSAPTKGERGKVVRRRPETAIPDDLAPDGDDKAYCRVHNLDLQLQWQQFTGHAKTNDRRCRNWKAAWKCWLAKAVEFQQERMVGRQSRDEHEAVKHKPLPTLTAAREVKRPAPQRMPELFRPDPQPKPQPPQRAPETEAERERRIEAERQRAVAALAAMAVTEVAQ